MAQRTAASPGQHPAGVWLSFPALFSDGDRAVAHDHEGDGSEAASNHSEVSELSALRLDISDIQEAIKNHDLWVQDAVAMRTDIDDMQAAIREHENWMGRLSLEFRQLQEWTNRFNGQLADIRWLIGSDASSGKAVNGLRRVSNKGDILGSAGRAGGSSRHRESLVSSGTKAADCDLTESGQAHDRIELGLTQQLGQGLHMLRTMVTAVEGDLSRQLDGERAARRAALSDLRREFAQALPSLNTPLHGDGSDCTPVGGMGFPTTFPTYDRQPKDAASHVQLETLVSELRIEVAALRAESQLQAVAAGALAIASGHISPQGRVRSIKALEDRMAVVQAEKQRIEDQAHYKIGPASLDEGFASLDAALPRGVDKEPPCFIGALADEDGGAGRGGTGRELGGRREPIVDDVFFGAGDLPTGEKQKVLSRHSRAG